MADTTITIHLADYPQFARLVDFVCAVQTIADERDDDELQALCSGLGDDLLAAGE